jgi:succinate dehydrogenase hydrophobic anchor subunit
MSLSFFIFIAISGSIFLPCVDALNAVLMRKMKGVHENTIACYVNPSMCLFMLLMVLAKGNS